MAKFDDLIARLETAAGGSQELDARIVAAVVGGTVAMSPFNGRWCVYVGTNRQGKPRLWIPTADRLERDLWRLGAEDRGPTRSIDAALTLIPEWASFELTQSAAGPPTFTRCTLWDWRRCATGFDPGNEWKAEGNRPLPINILIAALKARAQD